MKTIAVPLLATPMDLLRSRASLHLEVLALRQQLAMIADGITLKPPNLQIMVKVECGRRRKTPDGHTRRAGWS